MIFSSICAQPFLLLLLIRDTVQQLIPMYKGPSNLLTQHLLSQHSKAAPPDGHIKIKYDMDLVHILEVNELKQRISVLLYIEERWHDRTLSWNPADFQNLTKTWLPEDSIWLPDVLIFNMLNHDNLLHSVRSPVLIHQDGSVVFSFPAVYDVMCEIDIKDFPLDTQHCSLEVASWDYEEEKLQLSVSKSDPLDHYTENEEWKLIKVSYNTTQYHHEDFYVSEIFFNIQIKRKPLFYMINLVAPSFIITTLSLIGLFAPSSSTGEREEKFTLGVTAILTMAVLLLLVSEKVPHTSKGIPLLVAYFMADILLITTATSVTAFIILVHKKQRSSSEMHWILNKVFCIRTKSQKQKQNRASSLSSVLDEDCLMRSEYLNQEEALLLIVELLISIKSQLGRREERGGDPSSWASNEYPWVILAQKLDYLFMAIFISANTAFTLYLIVWSV